MFSDWLELLLFSSFTVGNSEPPADLQGGSFELVAKFAGCMCCNFEEQEVSGFDFVTASDAPGLAVRDTGFFGLASLEALRLFPPLETSAAPPFPDQETA